MTIEFAVVPELRMVDRETDFGIFLALLYNAATVPELWGDVLEKLADMVGAQSGWMSRHDVVRDSRSGLVTRMNDDAQARYFGHFIDLDPFRRPVPVPPAISSDEAFIAKSDLVTTEFYNDFMRPLDAHSILMIGLQADDLATVSVHLNRSDAHDRFDTDDMRHAALLHPHLIRATHVARSLESANVRADATAAALEHSPHAVLLLDAGGFVLHANGKAEALLAHRVGLRVVQGRLDAATAATSGKLGKLVAAATAPGKLERRGSLMLLAASEGRLPLTVTVAPLDPELAELPAGRARVIVTIADPNNVARPQGEMLADLFGLTAAETRVALLLAEGLAPREAAERLGVTFNTIRNQLKSIFDKVDVRRQGELVALLHRLAVSR